MFLIQMAKTLETARIAVQFCPQCRCKTWHCDDVCEWSDMHQQIQNMLCGIVATVAAVQVAFDLRDRRVAVVRAELQMQIRKPQEGASQT